MYPTSHRGSSNHRPPSMALPAIAEDRNLSFADNEPPAVPPRAWNRPKRNIFHTPPPAYSKFDSVGVVGPRGEKLSDLRRGVSENAHIARRGGWKRLCLFGLLFLASLVALIVGLVVGLQNRSKSNNQIPSSSPGGASGNINSPSDPTNASFPIGTYRIQTVLQTTATNCTSNPATWLCYPYTTYSSSPSASAASFDWIITSPSQDVYTISTTPNAFALQFTDVSLSLVNAGTEQEHYFLSTPLGDKSTLPTVALAENNQATTCSFHSTTLEARLYTKLPRTYPSEMVDDGLPMKWPYKAEVVQMAASQSGSPTCVGPDGTAVGDFSVQDEGQVCQCFYGNTGTD